jgi:TolB protein
MKLNRRNLLAATGAASLVALAGTVPAWALDVDVSGGKINPLPIAIAPFLAGSGSEDAAATVSGVIANNLGRSGYFNPLPPESFIERISDFEAQPNLESWRQVQAKALVTGQAYMDGGKLRVAFKLFDVNSGQMLASQSLAASPKVARRLAHRISDQIYKALTGFEGYFDTRVVFIDESGPKSQRVKKLAIMDQDGFNPRTLPVQGDLLLTPRFSPTANEVTFLSFGTGVPRVFIYNIDTNQKEIVGDFPNMSFAPRFSPDGRRIIMSLQSEDGVNSNLFEMNLQSRQPAPGHQCGGDQHGTVLLAGRLGPCLRVRSWRQPADLRDGRQAAARRSAFPSARAATPHRSGRRMASGLPSPRMQAASSRSA